MTASMLLVYLSAALVLQLGIAMSVALVAWRRAPVSQAAAPRFTPRTTGAWNGWRELRVVRRDYEDRAHTLCSFYLEPIDGAPLPPFVPGQFLTLSVPIDDHRTLTRCYSLSDAPNEISYRISVKRALAPIGRPDLPRGACSNHLHDRLQNGDIIQAKAPAGRFVVDPDSTLPIVLIAGGIGITPMLSLLRGGAATTANRKVYLFYGARCGAEQGFRRELEDLTLAHPNFSLYVVYDHPGPDDVLGQDFHQRGYVDLELLQRTLPAARHRYYVCGPPPMVESVISALLESGVLTEDIQHEAFGPATMRSDPMAVGTEISSRTTSLDVVFRKSGRTVTWHGRDSNLLDFADRHQVVVESGCRSGSCGSCEVRLISGTVHYAQKPEYDITPGHCLLCVGIPDSALELDA